MSCSIFLAIFLASIEGRKGVCMYDCIHIDIDTLYVYVCIGRDKQW